MKKLYILFTQFAFSNFDRACGLLNWKYIFKEKIMNSLWFMLLIQLVLIALNAIFASAEIAVISLNETKLEKMAGDGNRRAGKLAKMKKQNLKLETTSATKQKLSFLMNSEKLKIQKLKRLMLKL